MGTSGLCGKRTHFGVHPAERSWINKVFMPDEQIISDHILGPCLETHLLNSENKPLLREIDPVTRDLLRRMCNLGYIYLGRTGGGLTQSFRTEYLRKGGKAIEESGSWLGEIEIELLWVIATEGPRYVTYARLQEVVVAAATTATNPPRKAWRYEPSYGNNVTNTGET